MQTERTIRRVTHVKLCSAWVRVVDGVPVWEPCGTLYSGVDYSTEAFTPDYDDDSSGSLAMRDLLLYMVEDLERSAR